ncbi:MAG: hypothetical protein KAI96_03650 [Thermodesulfovibrionia bacterium]|nr:hypothetical protein [Thermodesulfovibrionia bacterium]
MQIAVKNKDIFPGEVRELLQALYSVGFFEESMLIGSWVMPLYQDAFSISYALRTQDIDFAVKFVLADRGEKVDIEKNMEVGLPYFMSYTGVKDTIFTPYPMWFSGPVVAPYKTG